MNIQKNVSELKRSKSQLLEQAKALLVKDTDETPWSDEQKKDYDDLMGKIDQHEGRITRCEKMLSIESKDADPVDTDDEYDDEDKSTKDDDDDDDKGKSKFNYNSKKSPLIKGLAYRTPADRKREGKGIRAMRYLIGKHVSMLEGDKSAGVRYVMDNFKDAEVAKALQTTTTAAGGALIPQDFSMDFIDVLWSKTVVRNTPGVTSFDAPLGNLTFPRLQGTTVAQWDTEGSNIALSQPVFDDLNLSTKRCSSMVPVSNQLIYQSPLSVERILLKTMTNQMARQEDATFLGFPVGAVSGAAGVPFGLNSLALPANTFKWSGTHSLANTQNFLWSMISGLTNSNVDTKGAVWYMHPTVRGYISTLLDGVGRPFYPEITGSDPELLGWKVLTTTNIPNGSNAFGNTIANATTIFFAQPEEYIIADTMKIQMESSAEASYVDSNGNFQSSFQKNQTLYRAMEFTDFNLQHPAAVSVGVVDWVPGYFSANSLSNVAVTFTTQPTTNSSTSAGGAVYT